MCMFVCVRVPACVSVFICDGDVTCVYVLQMYRVHPHSDVIIKLADRQMPGHRLILATRSSGWDSQDDRMTHTKELDLSHLSPSVAVTIIKWVYTDQVQLPQDEEFVTETLVGAERYKLIELKEK